MSDKTLDSLVDPKNIGKVFDEDQTKVLVDVQKAIATQVDARFQEGTEAFFDEALKKRGITDELLGATKVERAYLKLRKATDMTRNIWDNNGHVRGVSGRITYQDLCEKDRKRRVEFEKNGNMVDGVFSTDQPLIIPRVIEQLVREPVEPTIVLTGLLQRVNVTNAGTTITFPAIGDAMVAADIAEGAEYPESSLEFAGEVTAKIGKSGIAVKLTDEMIRYSMFDVMSMHLRAAGKALVRHKERKAADLIFNNGVTVFDNTATGKFTSGRGSDGVFNDTLTLDDILIMYADMANEGFIPDTLILHPFAWFAFAREPVMRALFMQFGGGQYYQTFQGSVGSANAWSQNTLNNSTVFGTTSGTAGSDAVGQIATTQLVPSILPTPLRVVVTPFQQVDLTATTTTITLADSSRLGVLLVDEEVNTEEFDDPARDIQKVKFRERYGLALQDNGQAIRHAKNVNWLNKAYALDDLLTWQAGTGALAQTALETGTVAIV